MATRQPKIIKSKPICKVDKDGTKKWYLNGHLHRKDGPAIEWYNGDKDWHLNGFLHREDGPAVEWVHNSNEWYLYGKYYSFQDYLKILKKMGKSDKDIILLALKYG
jgi:hypothetical protein